MFAARGIVVAFSVFALVYSALSVAVYCAWPKLWFYARRHPARRRADFLFALRVVPLFAAAAFTLALIVPSFVLLEPRAIVEPLGEVPLALGLCGLSVAVFGLVNAITALMGAWNAIGTWVHRADLVDSRASVPVLRISRAVPALTAAGILRPKVLLSNTAELVLAPKELQTALRHELAHVRRCDNLKKLLLRFVAFPGMQKLETAWLEATEMAADDAAVSNAEEALDLASALIKLSRLGPVQPLAALTTALVHSPLHTVNARIERLIHWPTNQKVSSPNYSGYALSATLAVVATLAMSYSQLLVRVHSATELLLR